MSQTSMKKSARRSDDKVERFVNPFGQRVTELRRSIQLYEEQLAERLGLTEDELMDIEQSEPALESHMLQLADYFDVSPRELYRLRGRKLTIKVFGDAVQYHRNQRGLSQKQLADLASCSSKTLWNAEREDTASPEVLAEIAKQLEVPYAALKMRVPRPHQELRHDFDFDGKEKLGRRQQTANGIRYDVFLVRSNSDPDRRFRAKRYDLSLLPTDDEVRIAAMLARHPQICYRLRDCPQVATHVTTLQQGKYCWVIDAWYEGTTLAELIPTKQCRKLLPPIMRDLALGLRAIHEAEVIYRELTPHSVVICQPKHSALLTDFELGKLLAAPITVAPKAWKSPHPYRAPEIGLPRTEVQPSADLYSWAVLFAHALSGESDCPENVQRVLESANIPLPLKKQSLRCLLPAKDRPKNPNALIRALNSWK